jgi:hypothetical protein
MFHEFRGIIGAEAGGNGERSRLFEPVFDESRLLHRLKLSIPNDEVSRFESFNL